LGFVQSFGTNWTTDPQWFFSPAHCCTFGPSIRLINHTFATKTALMNISLKQQLPPSQIPRTSGGFLSRYPTNPSKLRSLREPLDVSKTKNGPSTKLVVDVERVRSPTALERRVVLENAMKAESPFPYPAFNPSESQAVSKFSKPDKKLGAQKNTLIGGLAGSLLTNRSIEALAKVVSRRDDAECQCKQDLLKMEFENIQDYQKWSKNEVDPLLRELRKCLLSNRPEDLGLYLEAYGRAICEGREPPVCLQPEEIWANPPPETTSEAVSMNQSVKRLDSNPNA